MLEKINQAKESLTNNAMSGGYASNAINPTGTARGGLSSEVQAAHRRSLNTPSIVTSSESFIVVPPLDMQKISGEDYQQT